MNRTIITSQTAYDFALHTFELLNPEIIKPAQEEVQEEVQQPKEDPNRIVGTIDYSKFDHIDDEEEEQKKQAEEYIKTMCSQDHRKEIEIYERPTAEKLEACERFRGQGNDAFRNENPSLAAYLYRKAMLQLDYTFPDTEEEKQKFNDLELALHLNMGLCKFQQEEYDEAMNHALRALKLSPNHPKALYRRAQINLKRDLFAEAQQDLKKIIEIQPQNREARNLLSQLKEKKKNYRSKAKQVSKAMVENI